MNKKEIHFGDTHSKIMDDEHPSVPNIPSLCSEALALLAAEIAGRERHWKWQILVLICVAVSPHETLEGMTHLLGLHYLPYYLDLARVKLLTCITSNWQENGMSTAKPCM